MRNLRSYYSASIAEFLRQSSSEIIGNIHSNDISAETTIQQSNTWESEVQILKDQLRSFSDGRIIFEYTIPRMGRRVDAVVLYKNIVFLLEFKCGDTEYRQSTYDQVYDYALDLRNFQKESHDKLSFCLQMKKLILHSRYYRGLSQHRCDEKYLQSRC